MTAQIVWKFIYVWFLQEKAHFDSLFDVYAIAWKHFRVTGTNRRKYIQGAIYKMPWARNSLVFEDANVFKNVNAKYDEKWLVNKKKRYREWSIFVWVGIKWWGLGDFRR